MERSPSPSAKSPTKPKIIDMVYEAIYKLKERKGSSLHAIKTHMSLNYEIDIEKKSPYIKRSLKKALEEGNLLGTTLSGSFKLSPQVKADMLAKEKGLEKVEKKTQVKEEGLEKVEKKIKVKAVVLAKEKELEKVEKKTKVKAVVLVKKKESEKVEKEKPKKSPVKKAKKVEKIVSEPLKTPKKVKAGRPVKRQRLRRKPAATNDE